MNFDHGGEEEPTNDPVVNNEGDDSSAIQLEAEVSDLKQEIIHLKCQIHHLQSTIPRLDPSLLSHWTK